jgi:hypothetical protein
MIYAYDEIYPHDPLMAYWWKTLGSIGPESAKNRVQYLNISPVTKIRDPSCISSVYCNRKNHLSDRNRPHVFEFLPVEKLPERHEAQNSEQLLLGGAPSICLHSARHQTRCHVHSFKWRKKSPNSNNKILPHRQAHEHFSLTPILSCPLFHSLEIQTIPSCHRWFLPLTSDSSTSR